MADSVALQWPGLFAQRWRLPRVVEMQGSGGGLPIRQLRKVQDYIAGNLAEEISIERLAELVE